MSRTRSLAATVILLFTCAAAHADGVIVVTDGPRVANHFAFAPLEVSYHHVTVDIDDQVAVTSVDEEFYNHSDQSVEGTYLFPLPAGAHIDKFSMDINGKEADAEMLSADKARSIYEDIVRKMRDPALMEYAGRDAVKVRIFPIEANGRKHVKLKYTQLLTGTAGLCEYVYPLNTEKFSSAPIVDVSVTVNLHATTPIKSLYCPSHDVTIHRDGDRAATVSYAEHGGRPDTDFKLVIAQATGAVGISLLTCKSVSEDGGYFLLLASPGVNADKATVQPKDICFVLDTSGSMAGPKLEQAKRAMKFCLNNLNDGDGFEVVRFSSEAEPLFNGLKPAGKENVAAALKFVDGMRAAGGTAIDDALRHALSTGSRSSDRPYLVVFLTDGLPTVGERDEEKLVAAATATSATHVFCFGIGNDVNTHLLDRIAGGTRAASAYVGNDEDIEVKVSDIYAKIREPALTDVAVTIEGDGIHTAQMYPTRIPDLFKGEVLTAFGKYTGSGPGRIKFTGRMNGEQKEFTAEAKFTADDSTRQYIPRLWATRRIGWLLDEIRLHGESPELKEEATTLARQWGVVTPYTAYLITEDERARNVPLSLQSMRQFDDDVAAKAIAKRDMTSMAEEARDSLQRSGAQAAQNAVSLNDMRNSTNDSQAQLAARMAASPAIGAGPAGGITQPTGYRFVANYQQQVKLINGRSFYQNGNTWLDASAQLGKQLKQQMIKFNSDEYFSLMSSHPEAVAWFALGSDVDVVIGDTVYNVRTD